MCDISRIRFPSPSPLVPGFLPLPWAFFCLKSVRSRSVTPYAKNTYCLGKGRLSAKAGGAGLALRRLSLTLQMATRSVPSNPPRTPPGLTTATIRQHVPGTHYLLAETVLKQKRGRRRRACAPCFAGRARPPAPAESRPLLRWSRRRRRSARLVARRLPNRGAGIMAPWRAGVPVSPCRGGLAMVCPDGQFP